jgi:hypothetical protein
MSITVAESAYGQGPSTVTGGGVGLGLGLGAGVVVRAGTVVRAGGVVGAAIGAVELQPATSITDSTIPIRTVTA